jgi:cell division septation protein DedD
MSDFTFPQPQATPQLHTENRELALANRRLTTAILGMTLLTGLIACLSYLAGRTVTQIRTESATVVRTEIAPGPVVVNPINTPSPSITPVPPSAAPPVPAGLYLQVGLMDPAVDRSMQDRLVARGYAVKLAPMENSPVSRVLVGPIQSAPQQSELESKLNADGFQHFVRRF